jgi:hypothetical protein
VGVHENITHDKFPRQNSWLNRAVSVCFHYDTSHRVAGRIVRDDAEDPHYTIIALVDGRCVLSTECQYTLEPEE